MKSRHLFRIAAVVSMTLVSCTPPQGNPSKDKPTPEAPKLIGRIASIPADQRFVLIQSYGSWKTQAGTTLTTYGPDDRTACLLATGESLGQFAAADLQSGRVEVGDAVYSRRPTKPPTPATTPEHSDNKP